MYSQYSKPSSIAGQAATVTAPPMPPPSPASVGYQLSGLCESVSVLEDAVAKLVGALDPISTPPAPTACNVGSEPQLPCPLADRLSTISGRVIRVIAAIEDASNRISL